LYVRIRQAQIYTQSSENKVAVDENLYLVKHQQQTRLNLQRRNSSSPSPGVICNR
jgi:hypothetical protein